ncbi:hypothetical protein [Bufonid herpesvirus 1]|uniref:hypothetical protein n=1 Tax=Bufonid herpesvirus 1 TaxID=2282206 RepID=UPI000EB65E5A|nr:hypothetical protein [Bufonid herpesvirus 1]AXF48531.1 hypothetical protein [Bufonid herpesvirus 1]
MGTIQKEDNPFDEPTFLGENAADAVRRGLEIKLETDSSNRFDDWFRDLLPKPSFFKQGSRALLDAKHAFADPMTTHQNYFLPTSEPDEGYVSRLFVCYGPVAFRCLVQQMAMHTKAIEFEHLLNKELRCDKVVPLLITPRNKLPGHSYLQVLSSVFTNNYKDTYLGLTPCNVIKMYTTMVQETNEGYNGLARNLYTIHGFAQAAQLLESCFSRKIVFTASPLYHSRYHIILNILKIVPDQYHNPNNCDYESIVQRELPAKFRTLSGRVVSRIENDADCTTNIAQWSSAMLASEEEHQTCTALLMNSSSRQMSVFKEYAAKTPSKIVRMAAFLGCEEFYKNVKDIPQFINQLSKDIQSTCDIGRDLRRVFVLTEYRSHTEEDLIIIKRLLAKWPFANCHAYGCLPSVDMGSSIEVRLWILNNYFKYDSVMKTATATPFAIPDQVYKVEQLTHSIVQNQNEIQKLQKTDTLVAHEIMCVPKAFQSSLHYALCLCYLYGFTQATLLAKTSPGNKESYYN